MTESMICSVDIHVMALSQSKTDLQHEELKYLLAPEERDKLKNYKYIKRRREFIVARAVLRTALSKLVRYAPQDIPIIIGGHGKLEIGIADQKYQISLTHSRSHVMVAISENTVGIDTEPPETPPEFRNLARRNFHTSEADYIASLNDKEAATAFREFWTLKEAYSKMLGLGLQMDYRSFALSIDGSVPQIQIAPPNIQPRPCIFNVSHFPQGDTVAICAESHVQDLKIIRHDYTLESLRSSN